MKVPAKKLLCSAKGLDKPSHRKLCQNDKAWRVTLQALIVSRDALVPLENVGWPLTSRLIGFPDSRKASSTLVNGILSLGWNISIRMLGLHPD